MSKQKRSRGLTDEQERNLDSEIGFLEGLIGRDGEWVDALKLLADDYTRRGRVQEGLALDERLARLCPQDPYVFYNLACSFSLTERYEQAFSALDQAFRLGYDDLKWLTKDPDMANLRKHPLFKAFRGKLRAA